MLNASATDCCPKASRSLGHHVGLARYDSGFPVARRTGGSVAILRADPFSVTVTNDVDFTDGVLKPLFARSFKWVEKGQKDNRWGEYSESWVLLHHLQHHQAKSTVREHYVGSFFRAKVKDLPSRVEDGGISPLDVDGLNGLGEHVAFAWDPEKAILWLQRDKTIGKFVVEQHLRERIGSTVTLDHIFKGDAPKRARSLGIVNTFEFAYEVGVDDVADLGPLAFLADTKKYGWGRVEVKFTRVRGSHLKPAAKELVKDIANRVEDGAEYITKAKVGGQLAKEDEAELINLLKGRGDYKVNVASSKFSDPQRLMGAVRQIWLSNRDKVEV